MRPVAGLPILSLPGTTPAAGARLSPCFHTVLDLLGGSKAMAALDLRPAPYLKVLGGTPACIFEWKAGASSPPNPQSLI